MAVSFYHMPRSYMHNPKNTYKKHSYLSVSVQGLRIAKGAVGYYTE